MTSLYRGRASLKVLHANVELLDARECTTVVADDVFHYLRRMEAGAFDVALADPPYGTGDAERLVRHFRASPFARELWVEHPWREALPLEAEDRTRRYGDTALTLLHAES